MKNQYQNNNHVCHITTVHKRYDSRIYMKQCRSLAKWYKCSLIVADGKGSELSDGVDIIDTGKRSNSRLLRVIRDGYKAYSKALDLNANVYQFHDPELFVYGLFLKLKGKKVIYDMHEDMTQQVYVRGWIPEIFKKLIVLVIELFEQTLLKKFDFVFVPQEFMLEKFRKVSNTVLINNFVEENFAVNPKSKVKVNKLLYVGSISKSRGIFNILDAMSYLDCEMTIVGTFGDLELEQQARAHVNWHKINYLGFQDADEIKKLYAGPYIGLIPFNNEGQYGHPFVIKLFEYMSYGLPIIMPEHGSWPEFNSIYEVGINVNTEDPVSLSTKINELIDKDVEKYSVNGIETVKTKFLWTNIEERLNTSYNSLLE